MTDETLRETRDFFRKYRGSHYAMWHDGVLPQYKAIQVPPDVEDIWTEELERESIAKLKAAKTPWEFVSCCKPLTSQWVVRPKIQTKRDFALVLFPMIDTFAQSLEDYDKIWLVKDLLALHQRMEYPGEEFLDCCKKIIPTIRYDQDQYFTLVRDTKRPTAWTNENISNAIGECMEILYPQKFHTSAPFPWKTK